jgi:ubiquinone/menaquinone biosynthesis C-methylase UbiE
MATAFAHSAADYDRIRPSYPASIAEACLDGLWETFRERSTDVRILDVGAGTGIFTSQLQEAARAMSVPAQVVALDVSDAMLAEAAAKGLEVRTGSGENTGFESQSVHCVTYAQAWHWVDPLTAGREAARVVVPKGRLALVWNQLDVRQPWVHRLSRIMRSGDIFYDPSTPPRPGGRWRSPELITEEFTQRLTPQQVVELARSRSSYRKASHEQQVRCEENILDYLLVERGLSEDDVLDLPYLSFVWTFVRSSRVDQPKDAQ